MYSLLYGLLVATCLLSAGQQHRSMQANYYNAPQVCCTGTNGYYRSLIATGLVNADTIFATDISVTGSTNLDIIYSVSSITYEGDLIISGSLTVDQSATVPDWQVTDLTVGGSTQFSEGCVDGSWCIGQDLTVAGTTLLAAGAITRDLCVAGDSCIATVVTSTLTVTGTVTFQTALSLTVTTSADYVINNISTVSDLLISGSLTVPGVTDIQSSLTIDGDYTIRGSACTNTAFIRDHIYAKNLVASSGTTTAYSNMLDYSLIRLRKAAFQTVGNEYLLPGSGANAQFGSAVAISGKGDIVAIASPTLNTVSVYQRSYTLSGSQWALIQTIAAGSPPSSVALSADARSMAIGYETANASSGLVALYRYNEMTATWDLLQTIVGLDSGELFGHAVSLSSSGSILLVGAPQGNSGTGRAYLFYKQATCPNLTTESWTLRFALVAQAPQANAQFGSSVSIAADGGYASIGEPNRTDTLPGQGAAYLYALVGTAWLLQQGPILSPIPTNNGQFGRSVALANNGWYLIIGDPARTTAVIYGKTAYNDWIVQYDLTPPDGLGTAGDGVSISFDGTVAIASDTSDSAISGGRILVAERFTNRWKLRYVLSPATLASGDTFGASTMVAADGAFVIAGAPGASGSIGSAYVYSPLCTDMPTDLAVTGTLCIGKNVTIDGNLVVQKSISYGGTQNAGVVVPPCGICSSDSRLKHTIEELKGAEALQLLKKLRPVTFYWKHPQVHPELGEHPISCIAQEVEQIMPHWVDRYEADGPDRLCTEDGTLLALAYKPDVYAYLVASLRYLSERLEYLEGLYEQRAKGSNHDQ